MVCRTSLFGNIQTYFYLFCFFVIPKNVGQSLTKTGYFWSDTVTLIPFKSHQCPAIMGTSMTSNWQISVDKNGKKEKVFSFKKRGLDHKITSPTENLVHATTSSNNNKNIQTRHHVYKEINVEGLVDFSWG